MSGRIVGIDLGTTNCCVAALVEGRPVVLKNRAGYPTTPSVIAMTEDGRRVVGQLAVRQMVTNPRHTVHAAKRLIGRTFDSREVSDARARVGFEIVPGPSNDARVKLRDRVFSIPELFAIFLEEARSLAEAQLEDTVVGAVVTVPAYFNDNQRQAVRDAARIAGLDVPRILNEPTAAAIAFGEASRRTANVAVYDMGGGTFDVSIVRCDPATGYQVLSTTGDSYLGGEDFDGALIEELLRRLAASEELDLSHSPLAMQRLREAATKARCELSESSRTDVQLPFLHTRPDGSPLHFETELKCAELESLTQPLIDRSLASCARALELAQLLPGDIDEVVLVGGMTRMPAVARAVQSFFGRSPNRGVHPDEAVAIGAAIVAAQLEGATEEKALRDVTAHSLGIMVAGGGFDAIIPANTAVPCRVCNVFTTSRDLQTSVKIVVLEGESNVARENEFLGQFALSNLRPAAAGEVEVEVAFEIDAEGMFRVAAIDRETGEAQTIDVLAKSGIAEDELLEMMREAREHMAERRERTRLEHDRQTIAVLLAEIERILPTALEHAATVPVARAKLIAARGLVEDVRRTAPSDDDLSTRRRELEALRRELLAAVEAV